MFKKYIGITAVCVAGMFTAMAPQTADASASFGGNNGGEQPTQTETQPQENNNIHSSGDWEQFFNNYFSNWNHDQEQENEQATQPEEVEQQPEANQPAPKPEVEESKDNDDQETQANDLNQFEKEVVELTNQEREKHGLSALKIDNELSKVARDKSKDMQENGYFDHNSPTYGSPFDMMQSYNIDYRSAGENIARGQRSPEEVVDGWMNSEGHRENILNESFTHIGVGYIEEGNHWTQQFIGK